MPFTAFSAYLGDEINPITPVNHHLLCLRDESAEIDGHSTRERKYRWVIDFYDDSHFEREGLGRYLTCYPIPGVLDEIWNTTQQLTPDKLNKTLLLRTHTSYLTVPNKSNMYLLQLEAGYRLGRVERDRDTGIWCWLAYYQGQCMRGRSPWLSVPASAVSLWAELPGGIHE